MPAENAQLSQQNLSLQTEAKRAATDQAAINDLKQQIEHLQQELADSRNELEITRRQVAQQAAPLMSSERLVASPATPRRKCWRGNSD